MGTWQTYDGRVYDDDGTLVEVDGRELEPLVDVPGPDCEQEGPG